MVIYGVALLAGSMLVGVFVGDVLGRLIGVQANVGGVGIAMFLLILLSDVFRKRGGMKPLTRQGVLFWSAIYIPIVVAMAAKQNVIAAVKGGPAAILAGAMAVFVSFLLVPALSRLGGNTSPALPGSDPNGVTMSGGEAAAASSRGAGEPARSEPLDGDGVA